MTMGISGCSIADTPITVVDTETTGLYPGGDRVIELAVVRIEPNAEPVLVLDTLLNPGRPVAATEIHGITDADVADAPRFADVAPALLDAMRGSVFAAYNVYFDAKFLQDELGRLGVSRLPPHVCLMYLRPMLALGRKCSLRDACASSSISITNAHQAAADAMAAARLWKLYVAACRGLGVTTFAELAALKNYKFTMSFSERVFDSSPSLARATNLTLKPRGTTSSTPVLQAREPKARYELIAEYWDGLTTAFADSDITPHEVFYLKAKGKALGIRPNELRWMHARVFSSALATVCNDHSITDQEATSLSELAEALRELGWAPGDSID